MFNVSCPFYCCAPHQTWLFYIAQILLYISIQTHVCRKLFAGESIFPKNAVGNRFPFVPRPISLHEPLKNRQVGHSQNGPTVPPTRRERKKADNTKNEPIAFQSSQMENRAADYCSFICSRTTTLRLSPKVSKKCMQTVADLAIFSLKLE
jgi:hypothetical protein